MGTDAAKQVADKAERAAARPVTPSQDESDGDDGIQVPDTPPNAGEITGESQGGTSIILAIPFAVSGGLQLASLMLRIIFVAYSHMRSKPS